MKKLGLFAATVVAAMSVFTGVAMAGEHCNPTPPPAPQVNDPNSAYLCYSVYQVTPGSWSEEQAQTLKDEAGYWAPVAVLGNVEGDTNVGAYHLTCQTAGTTATDTFVDSGGFVIGDGLVPWAEATVGFYRIVS